MKNKKLIFIIIAVIVVGLFLIIGILKPINVKSYDLESIQDNMINYYDNMRIMDFVDLIGLFGIDLTDTEDEALFLTNYENEIIPQTIMVIIINSDDTELYYDLFRSFLDANKLNTDDMDLLNYYDKAKLVQGNGYIYFLLGENTDDLEKEIYAFYH